MKYLKRLIFIILLSFILPASAYTLELTSQSGNVFKFQQKLAAKGNAGAQYKLGCMYEFGTGTKQDIDQAQHWYEQASIAGVKAASDRMTYLLVKQQGYDQVKYSDWLNSVKKDANESKGDAMFLLAQLYREGIGVGKDLNKSLEILDQVSLLGAADIENEVALIQQEIDANNKAKTGARQKHKIEVARLAQQKKEKRLEQLANIEQQKAQANEAPVSKEQQAEAEKAALAAKRQRYEKAMMKMKLEQRKIDEQQAWAAGGDSDAATADDEI